MTLTDAFSARGIRCAVIIDDAFDDEPRFDELDELSWATFFDDLDETAEDLLRTLYPPYATASVESLKSSQEFVRLLWQHRQTPELGMIGDLVEEYTNRTSSERKRLEELAEALRSHGLSCSTMGREIESGAETADLLFVDLFLGIRQTEEDVVRTVTLIKELVRNRPSEPPLVALMSRSPRLARMADEFRDSAGLLASTFRVIGKEHLVTDGALEALLKRLVDHYDDAKRVARFVQSWDSGLERARRAFVGDLRRLDLSDLGQVRALLLDAEEQTLGEYLLDVADSALQYEIERDDATLEATLGLNKIELDNYPAPHLMGTPDLQHLVYRRMFVNRSRLRLSEHEGAPQLRFGDLLRRNGDERKDPSEDVLLVVSPACDLIRPDPESILLLGGQLRDLDPISWTYDERPVKTAIVILPNDERKWIQWDLEDFRTLSANELGKEFVAGRLTRVGRLRAMSAIWIQQMLLAHLGRVGLPANLPVSFPVSVAFFYVDTEGKAASLGVAPVGPAACYVGRREKQRTVHRLVLTEQTCDQVRQRLSALSDDQVHRSAKASLAALRADGEILTRFEHGEIDMSSQEGTKYIKSDGKLCVAICRNEQLEEAKTITGSTRKAALIVQVTDIAEQEWA